jgi:uncharacterized protein
MNDKLSKYISLLDKNIRHRFSKDACHDMYHLYRVFNLALKIQDKEGGDRLVIGVAAFLHDVHRVIQFETKKYCSPKDSLPVIRKLLLDVKFPEDRISKVLRAIEFHEEYSFTKEGKTAKDLEVLILQDADNLDAMGAIGIARCFSFSSLIKKPMWIPEDNNVRKHYDDSKLDASALHHFHSKLFKLKDNMNTKTAKAIAKERHQYMIEFVDRFKKEWYAKI